MPADLTIRPVSEAPTAADPAFAARTSHVKKTPDAAQKFEAFVLQSFIQEMMPDTAQDVFGSGVSGDFWKSMMAEKIAEQVAARGSLGIAEAVRAGHVAPIRPGGFSSSEVMSHVSTLNSAVAAQLDVKPNSGE